jgi:Carboxypeptidase regulatory-like domain
VILTSLGTAQTRTATTGAAGDYKFSLLPPGNYQLKFQATGFKTSTLGPITVNVTETETANQSLQVGSVSESVTVEANVETLQTESSTLGTTVSGNTIQALPMANGNYTEILSLSAGATAGVDNATSLGKGTQDISANGVDPGSNNYQMDGVAVNNIANSGSSNDGTIYTGIPVPSPDAIAEFKIQTSTYDASYGRNPGANVNVTTKSGTNDFHGTAFEFFRNSILNADDFFYIKSPGHDHQVLDQNQFGGTIGGPIKKDKLFFFFSYRGTHAKNGVAAAGTTNNVLLPALPTTRTAATIGAALCAYNLPGFLSPQAPPLAVACDGSNVSPQGVALLNLPGPGGGGFYIPSPQLTPQFCTGGHPYFPPFITAPVYQCNYSIPALYHEKQFVANGDYIINSKQTLVTRYFYTLNPQQPFLGQNGGNLPGTPENILFGNQNAVLKLTSLVTNNFVNEARVSFQRNTDNSSVTMPDNGHTNTVLGITPGTGGYEQPPNFITFIDGLVMFGGLLPNFGPTNQWQLADQISWQHGKHSIRAGYEYEGTNWPLLDSGLEQGLMFAWDLNSIVVGSTGFNQGCVFCVESIPGENGITHFYNVQNQDAYVLDDWKVSPRLTLNIGLRWEFDGLLSDRLGRLTQVQLSRMAANSAVPTSLAQALSPQFSPVAIQQYVVASNFEKFFGPPPAGVGISPNKNSVEGHAPYSNFAPRLGFAWQPLSGGKLVVRGGAGIFYNRIGLDSVVHAFEQGAPYAQTYDYGTGSARWMAATLANPYPALNLVPLASNPLIGFSPRFSNWTGDPATSVSSGLNTPLSYTSGVHTPLVREYSLGIQYEFIPGWVLDLGYVGSSGINLNDYNHNHNQALLATPTNSLSSFCTGTPPVCNTVANAQYRVPYLGYEAAGLDASDSNGYSNYNSLQVTVRHQFSHGLSMQAAYTWDKNLSDIFYSNSANIDNQLDVKSQYGRVSFDRPQRLSVNYSYDLPFGKGTTGIENKLIAGWNVSGVTVAQSGDVLTFESSLNGAAYGTNNNSYLSGTTTAYFCSGSNNGNIKNPGGTLKNLGAYFNFAGFCTAPVVPFGDPGDPTSTPVVPAATGFGDSGIGGVTGPGQFNWDISILKNTKITERVNMQFRTDFYNAFNHPQFSDPGGGAFGSIGFVNTVSTTADEITHTNVNPRLIQFGVRFNF